MVSLCDKKKTNLNWERLVICMHRKFRETSFPFSLENATPNLRLWWPPPHLHGGFLPPTSSMVFPSSCRSILLSSQLSPHPFLESFSFTIDLLSLPRTAAKLSFPPMRPPPEPQPQNIQMAVTVVSPISNPKTVFQALSLIAAPHLHGWHPPALHRSLHPFPPLQ